MYGRVCFPTCVLLFVLLEGSAWAWHHLDEALITYGTLHKDDVIHRIIPRRNSLKPNDHFRRVVAAVVDRNFVLELTPHEGLFSPNFQVISHNGNGKLNRHFINVYQFYNGQVHGNNRSHAWVHIDDDNIITATITVENDTYHIEPSWRHFKEPHPFHMITYKSSDIISSLTACGTNIDPVSEESFYHMAHENDMTEPELQILRRRKRFVGDEACEIALVADYLFFSNIGGGNVGATAQYLVNIAGHVDRRLQDTNWGDGFNRMGILIKKVYVHEQHSNPHNSQEPAAPYNEQKSHRWKPHDYLTAIGYSEEGFDDFCLVHVFTYQDFLNGLLGLAPIASPRKTKAGGICSFVLKGADGERHTNVGFSTALNFKRTLLIQEMYVVTQHEIGHNWGSLHDPSQCDQNYIMSALAVAGKVEDNFKFSDCSKSYVLPVLKVKSHCFTDRPTSICGNGYRENGEDCDGGLLISGGPDDSCCTADCKFRLGATCSDRNDPCCHNCTLAPNSTLCYRAATVSFSCLDDTYCSGVNASCPKLEVKANGTECAGMGQCMGGSCMPFCETKNLTSCVCDNEDDECKVCCQTENQTSSCKVFEGGFLHLDGTLCSKGVCDDGKCVSDVQDLISKFWNFIRDLSVDSIAEWIRNNIVAAVLFFSLILWVPICVIFHYFDHQRRYKVQDTEKDLRDREDLNDTDSGKDLSRASLLRNEETIRPWYSLEEDPSRRTPVLYVN